MPAATACRFGEPRSSTIGSSGDGQLGRALRGLHRSWRRWPKAGRGSASSLRNLMRSLPLAAASASRSTKTGVRLFLPALIASARPGGSLDREAHDRLVDRADLLDIEGAVGEALARRRPSPAASSALRGCAGCSRRRRRARAAHRPWRRGPPGRETDPGRTACRRAPARSRLPWPLWMSRNSASSRPQPPRRSSMVSGLSAASSVSRA